MQGTNIPKTVPCVKAHNDVTITCSHVLYCPHVNFLVVHLLVGVTGALQDTPVTGALQDTPVTGALQDIPVTGALQDTPVL
jgi:hypothetical protein